ncbi:hypothetical protein [Brumimicrobium mesophilum]|uniref:hypothetical protein n=1 Tax=Brumimicrobium mesophilum TaxID=392717 RepID=UPI000D1407B0|nr:hypothetical protein [Brumimicrobium mesophilum]
MKNRIPILFILALTLPFVGIYGWLKFEKAAIQKTVKRQLMEGIPKEELIQFTFALSDTSTILDWKHGKEFELNGEMYDVVTRYYSTDSVKYDLWWDHEETELNRKLAKLTNSLINQNSEESSKNGFISFVLKSIYYDDNQVVLSSPFENSNNVLNYDNVNNSLISRDVKPISPPPQFSV